jgi:hypothetical protein
VVDGIERAAPAAPEMGGAAEYTGANLFLILYTGHANRFNAIQGISKFGRLSVTTLNYKGANG